MRTRFLLFLIAAAVLVASHALLLGLPFFWDEMGQFVPAALDIYRTGAWVPHSTLPNIHPPGVMVYLALAWKIAGFSIAATRVAMLLMAAAGIVIVFLLAIRLCRDAPGMPALVPPLLLLASPLFFSQAMMAQLDMPAMVFASLALLLFLEDHILWSVAACAVLVMMKETGAVLPALFGFWLLREKRWKDAVWFVLPALPLVAWVCVLKHATGSITGNREFAEYNLFYPLQPVRLAFALLRRFYTLFIGQFHWIGAIAIVAGRKLFRSRDWRVAGVAAAVQLATVTFLGGATLERYLLPVLPILYSAMALGWSLYSRRARLLSQAALLAGLIAMNFVSSPLLPFPFENNLAMVDFIRLDQAAATVLETSFRGHTVTTAWPLTAALRRPDYGYVREPARVRAVTDFTASALAKLDPAGVDVFLLYSRDWEPRWSLLRLPALLRLRELYYGYQPPVAPEEIMRRFQLEPVARWEKGGQWIEILARPGIGPEINANRRRPARETD